MAHYAFLDKNNIVIDVITGKDEGSFDWELHYGSIRGQLCKRTSYNTHFGVHSFSETPFRKNYAGIGYTYDAVKDAFISPQPYPSWTLDETSATWDAPITYPSVITYFRDPSKPALYYFIDWDEDNQRWIALDGEEPNGEFVWNVETDSWDSINT